MKCCVDGCDRDARYKEKQLCQMHYFRVMRNSTTELRAIRDEYRAKAREFKREAA